MTLSSASRIMARFDLNGTPAAKSFLLSPSSVLALHNISITLPGYPEYQVNGAALLIKVGQ